MRISSIGGIGPRVRGNAARVGRCYVLAARGVIGGEIVGGPFPDISRHITESVAVGAEVADRGGTGETVFEEVLPREFPLPDVAAGPAARLVLVAPYERLA